MSTESNFLSTNIFELTTDTRDSQKVKEALGKVLEVMESLDLTVGECQKFMDLIFTAITEKKIKF